MKVIKHVLDRETILRELQECERAMSELASYADHTHSCSISVAGKDVDDFGQTIDCNCGFANAFKAVFGEEP